MSFDVNFGDGSPLATNLARITLSTAAMLTKNQVGREEIFSIVIAQATRDFGVSDAEYNRALAVSGGGSGEYSGSAFFHLYRLHREELGDPASDYAQERCLAVVRRALEAVPDFGKIDQAMVADPPDVTL